MDVAAGASAAIRDLGPAVYGYLCLMLDEDDARDVFSQWSEDLWRGLPGFRRECTLRAWAFRLAWHAMARHLRDPYRARGERLPTSAASRLAASVAAASSALPGGRRDQLRKLRETLPPEDQTLLHLRIDKELEWEEIASVLADGVAGTSAATLRKRFERLKARLAKLAREEGLLG
ncbi:MAG TPA: sigma-70 family RNA polymerase sigma factor [Anaeromyxobacter sp.]